MRIYIRLFVLVAVLLGSCLASFTLKAAKVRAVAALAASLTVGSPAISDDGANVRVLLANGAESFRKGSARESVEAFDKALSLEPKLLSSLWQRGLAQYAADMYEECSEQFRADLNIASHAGDSEEWVFACACDAKRGVSTAPLIKRASSDRREDRRAIMNQVWRVFSGDDDVTTLLKEASSASTSPSLLDQQRAFYALFYAGLYNDAVLKDSERALTLYGEALGLPYASFSNDYMVTTCKTLLKTHT